VPRTHLDPRFRTVFPDSRPALAGLREAGWRHVILSNHHHPHRGRAHFSLSVIVAKTSR
jgi:hypothetical protein